MSETPKQHLDATEVAPHGWDLWPGHEPPWGDSTAMYRKSRWYIPAKPKPRTWTGTNRELFDKGNTDAHPLCWSDDMIVTVTETPAPPCEWPKRMCDPPDFEDHGLGNTHVERMNQAYQEHRRSTRSCEEEK